MHKPFGPIALLGSGETSLAGGGIFKTIARRLPCPIHIALLETPAGFELNSPQIAWRVGEFLKTRLQNYNPIVDVVPDRKRGTPFSPVDPNILQPLLKADIIFMGPGSPTYAVRQLPGSLAWDLVRARHRQGAALVFASAATIAVGEYALPVYEIYKVGEDVRVVPGLGLFADFGLSLSFIPHWNNTDGGADVDTSRCFVGMDRFTQWCDLLPPGYAIVGLDEHTGLIIDFESGKCTVNGISSVTLLRECHPGIYPTGSVFPVEELGNTYSPDSTEDGLPATAWEMVRNAVQAQNSDEPPAEIARLAEERQQARLRRDWAAADIFRRQIAVFGWIVQDTPEGQKIVRQS
ncbi:MAG: cysteinyl-tRNA synthetase [Chloroflexi bacterium]|nr:cysteinyl-tRNA synthetase [Chloroflexota bacterium]